MRVMVFFDLPVQTTADRRAYTAFRRYLLKSGFLMLQESVYCHLALNMTAVQTVMNGVRQNKPPRGLVQMLVITEKQFARMEFVLGEWNTNVIDSEERLVFL